MQKTWTWAFTGYQMLFKSDEEVISLCRNAGASGIEGNDRRWAGLDAAGLDKVARMYRDAGLSIDSYHLPFTADEDIANFYETLRNKAVDNLSRSLETAAAVGARVAVLHPSTNRCSIEAEGLDRFLGQMAKSMEALLPRAESLNVVLAIENMQSGLDGTRIGSRPEHFALFEREFASANMGYCLDTGHALLAGGADGQGEFFDAMAGRMASFHLADNAGDRDMHIAPGRGLVDWAGLFPKMARRNYAHPACIEAPPFAPGPNQSHTPEQWKAMVEEAEALVAAAG